MQKLKRRDFVAAGVAAGFSPFIGRAMGRGLEVIDHGATASSRHAVGGSGCRLCQAVMGSGFSNRVYQRPAATARISSLLGMGAEDVLKAPSAQGSGSARIASETVIVEPSWVMVPDGQKLKLLRDYDVVVKGDLIEDVRPHRANRDQHITARGQILLPGFISGHTHSAAGVMTRGFIEENSFASVRTDDPKVPSRSLLRPMVLMEDLSDQELDDLTALNLAEMLRSGCTTQVEMSLSLKQMKSYVRVATRFGIRGYPGAMVPGMKRLLAIWGRADDKVLMDSVPETLAEIQSSLAFARLVNGSANGRIRPMMAPSVTSVHTRDTFGAIHRAAAELGNGIHIHIQNDWEEKDRKALLRLWHKLEIPVLQELDLLGAPTFGAHLLGIDLKRDLPILAANKFTFAHCPSAAGASVLPSSQPYPEALAARVNTCIGLDTHSNDYLENIKLAVMQGRARTQLLGASSPVAMLEPTIWNALESATRGGARGLGRADLGRIEAGAKADFSTVDVSGLLVGNGALPREPYNNLLYANGLSVRNVMTDGNWQVRDGKFIVEDESEVVARGAAVVQKVWALLEKEGFFVPMPR